MPYHPWGRLWFMDQFEYLKLLRIKKLILRSGGEGRAKCQARSEGKLTNR